MVSQSFRLGAIPPCIIHHFSWFFELVTLVMLLVIIFYYFAWPFFMIVTHLTSWGCRGQSWGVVGSQEGLAWKFIIILDTTFEIMKISLLWTKLLSCPKKGSDLAQNQLKKHTVCLNSNILVTSYCVFFLHTSCRIHFQHYCKLCDLFQNNILINVLMCIVSLLTRNQCWVSLSQLSSQDGIWQCHHLPRSLPSCDSLGISWTKNIGHIQHV